MQVQIAAGIGFVPGTHATNQGTYVAVNPGTVTLTLTTANATNPRIDLIVLQILDSQYSGASNLGQLARVTGTPSASPTAPAVPSTSIALAEVRVNANVTSVSNASITDRRVSTSAFGGIPIVSSANSPSGAYVGQSRFHPSNRFQAWDGTRWMPGHSSPRACVSGTGTQTIGHDVSSVVVLNSIEHIFGGMTHSTSNGRLSATQPGWYLVSGGVCYSFSFINDNGFRFATIAKNGSPIGYSTGSVFGTTANTIHVPTKSVLVSLNTGDFLTLLTQQNSGSSAVLDRSQSVLTATYQGWL